VLGKEHHSDTGHPALWLVCNSIGGSLLTMAPDTIAASDAATSDHAADPEPPAMVTRHRRGTSPSIATAAAPLPVFLASMYTVMGMFPFASVEAGAGTSRTAAARPLSSSVNSPPLTDSTLDIYCVHHESTVSLVFMRTHAPLRHSGELPCLSVVSAQW